MLFVIDEAKIQESLKSIERPDFVAQAFNLVPQIDYQIPVAPYSVSGTTTMMADVGEIEPAFGVHIKEAAGAIRRVFGS
ncbi:MAG: hypothetical protein ACLQM6_00925 [Acidobacteriaceae bacterium]